MTAPHLPVHVRVNDAATGQPTPCRIRFVNSAGVYLAPLGRLTEFSTIADCTVGGGNVQLGKKKYCYIDGSCEIHLPADAVAVEVHKGPEYTPLVRQVVVGPGKLALRLAVERWTDLRKERWYSGDVRANHLPPHAALLEGAAEDVAVVNLLAVQETLLDSGEDEFPCISNITAFSGQRPALEMPGHMVVVNTQNWHPYLGSLGLLNCHRVVYPLQFGTPPRELNDWSLAAWCDQCHRKGGLVVWCDFQPLHANYQEGTPLGSEALANLILGKIDAVEFDFLRWEDCPAQAEWYRLLNCGLRATAVGGSAKQTNCDALGSVRTYGRLGEGEEFTYKNWIEAVRAGRSFVTNGPLLTFTVNGQEPGLVLDLVGLGHSVHVRAEARCALPFEHLEIIFNGTPVARTCAEETTAAVLDTDVSIATGGWLAARCGGRHELHAGGCTRPQTLSAHTSPVYIRVAGQPIRPEPDEAAPLLRLLENTLTWIADEARFDDDRQREHLAGIFQSAREVLRKRLAESGQDR